MGGTLVVGFIDKARTPQLVLQWPGTDGCSGMDGMLDVPDPVYCTNAAI